VRRQPRQHGACVIGTAATDSLHEYLGKGIRGTQLRRILRYHPTQDGNILAVGATNHLHMPPYSGDVLFIKLTLAGDVIWERTWGGDGYEQADAVCTGRGWRFFIFW